MNRAPVELIRRLRRFAAGGGLVLAFVAGFSALAFSRPAAPAGQAPNFTLEGKISDLAPGKLTLSTQDNMLFHVRYTDKTRITRADGSSGTAKDFKLGLAVHVAGDLEESGEINAAEIHILPAAASHHPHEAPPGG